MSSATADRNLLFGILALQMDFIRRDALIAAMNAWVLDKATPLGEILARQDALRPDHRTLLEGLVEAHLKQHDNDPQKSLAAVSSIGSAREELEQISDVEVQASLVQVSAVHPECDFATRAPSVGEITSAGTRFRILRPHARGGLGEVFVAEDGELHREVALKEIQDRHADNPASRARFMLEAEITGGLEHPGIVPVYGLGTYADGRPFYAMRFIRGDSLKDAIDRFYKEDRPQDSGERAVEFRKLLGRFVDVCNAIAYAHSRGVLHRDLKPGNIMLGKYGETLVVDWGLAKPTGLKDDKSTDEAPLQASAQSGTAETVAGSAIGTPQFMSPEQAAGRLDQLGPGSDVYSLGATFYVLLTGKPPFSEADVGQILNKVQRGAFPAPCQVNPTVSPALEAICLKAMATKPDERYQTVQALSDELERFLADDERRRIEAEAGQETLKRELAERKKAENLYFATINQEIRTPLDQITGCCLVLEHTKLDEEQKKELGNIRSAVGLVLHVMNDIYDYQKLVMGRFQVNVSEFDLSTLVREVSTSLAEKAAEGKNHVNITCAQDVGAMNSDRARISQVLYTLLGNACTFTRTGSISIVLESRSDWVTIRVSDTGSGISSELIDKIFEPSLNRKWIKRRPAVTGLHIIKAICERLGGSINCTSELGQGTTFTVLLPRRLTPA